MTGPTRIIERNVQRLRAQLADQERAGQHTLASLTRQYLAQAEAELARRAEDAARREAAS